MQIFQFLQKKLYDINYQTKLFAFLILLISLIISTITFSSLTSIQEDFILTDEHFSKNLSWLFTSNLSLLIDQNNQFEISNLIESIYLHIANIRYLMVLDSAGQISCSFPEYSINVQNLIIRYQFFINHDMKNDFFYIPSINYALFFNDQIIRIIIPVIVDNYVKGAIQLGIDASFNIFFIFKLVQYISLAVFVSIWSTFIIAIIFIVISLIKPMEALWIAMQNISKGNFSQRVDWPVQGYLANLIISFNEMAEKLEFYEKQNIEQLTIEKSKLETLISIIADGAILLDPLLRIIFINQAALKTLEIITHGIVGTCIYDHFPHYINQQFLPILNKMVQSNEKNKKITKTQSIVLKFNNQRSKILRFVLTTISDQNRSILTGIAIIIEDITSEIALNEAKAQFISNISHELRTPLFNIRSFLETLYEYNDSLSEIQKKEFLDIANQETQRLTLLVNDVLDLSRLESDLQYNSDTVILTEIIPLIIQTSKLRAKQKQVILLYRICSSIFKIDAYYNLLIQVISNLLDNSVKFIHIGGRIVIKAYRVTTSVVNSNIHTGDKVRIQIIDEGLGIRFNDQSRIFDRFVRIENNIHMLEGTGLGLSIVKNIVEKHKSRILLYSELGVGSSFWFDLLLLEKNN
jgi:two-component system, OmpR family, sensor histidine kinase NblS